MEEEGAGADSSKFLLSHDDPEQAVDPEMQARLEALLQAAGKLLLFIYWKKCSCEIIISVNH